MAEHVAKPSPWQSGEQQIYWMDSWIWLRQFSASAGGAAWTLAVHNRRREERHEVVKELLRFQVALAGDVKGPGQFFQPAKESQGKKEPQIKSRVLSGKRSLMVKTKPRWAAKPFVKNSVGVPQKASLKTCFAYPPC